MGARRAARPAEQRPASPPLSRPPGEPGRASENGGAPREGLEGARSPPRSAARPRSRLGPGVPELPEEAGREMGELLPRGEGRRRGRRTPL